MTDELLTADELAVRLRVRPSTVRNWSRRGLIPVRKLSPKVLRYVAAEVIDALANPQRKEARHAK